MRFHSPAVYESIQNYVKEDSDNKRNLTAFITSETHPDYPGAIALYMGKNNLPVRIGYVKAEDAREFYNAYPALRNNPFKLNVSVVVVSKFYTKVGVPLYSVVQYSRDKRAELDHQIDAMSSLYDNTMPIYTKTAKPQLNKESNMAEKTMVSQMIDKNADVARSAAFLEAGRIANNQVAKFAAAKAPLMVKGYVDTPIGKLLIANMANVAAQKFRKGDSRLQELTEAMMVEAWQEVYRIIDIEKMINEMLDNDSIKRALSNLETKAPA
jgi:hypothetical protein